MLTIFSCPKVFRGRIGVIQRNAIKSWTLLKPYPEIILIGGEEGTSDISREFNLRYVPTVERNKYGTPLVSSVFEIGQAQAAYPVICYLNADLILMGDFFTAIKRVLQKYESCVIIGRKWDMQTPALDFSEGWEQKFEKEVKEKGRLHPLGGIDYFVFPCGFFVNLPPFALGRTSWDNWLVYFSRRRNIPVIDITQAAVVVHQVHDYSHHAQKELGLWGTEEAKYNFKLAGGHLIYIFTIRDATFRLTSKGLKRNILGTHYIHLVMLCRYLPFLKTFIYKLRILRDFKEWVFYRKLLKEYAHKQNTAC